MPASQAASVPASPPAPAPRSPPRRPRAAIQRQIHLAGASQPEAEADPPRSSSEPCFSSDATLSSFSQPHASKEMASTRGDGFDAWGSQPPLSELSDLDLNSQVPAAEEFPGIGLYGAVLQGDGVDLFSGRSMGSGLPPNRPQRAGVGDAWATPATPYARQVNFVACMALHNFIRESRIADREFDACNVDENYNPMPSSSASTWPEDEPLIEDINMNAFRDQLAGALFKRRERIIIIDVEERGSSGSGSGGGA